MNNSNDFDRKSFRKEQLDFKKKNSKCSTDFNDDQKIAKLNKKNLKRKLQELEQEEKWEDWEDYN